MKKQNLFDSPRLTTYHFSRRLNHAQVEPQDENHLRSGVTPFRSGFTKCSPLGQCPFSVKSSLPEKIRENSEESELAQIESVVHYSEEEENMPPNVETPHQKTKKNEDLNTTGCKSLTERSIDTLKSRPKDKGLKGLSGKAYNAVLQLRVTNYKAVANKLLNEFSGSTEAQSATEETNVKRRVYDALNVLIAMGILRKDGKSIIAQSDPTFTSKARLIEKSLALEAQLRAKQEILKEKRRILEETKKKMNGVNILLKRNTDDFKQSEKTGKIIRFPYIGANGFTEFRVKTSPASRLQIAFDRAIRPFGDMDSLKYL